MELRFRRALGDAEQVGDLPMLQSFHVVQHEHRSRAGRERGEGTLEIQPVDHTEHWSGTGRGRKVIIEPILQGREPTAPAPQVIQAQVRAQAEQPCAERRLAPVQTQLAMRREKHLLKQVFRFDPAHEPACEAEEPWRVRAVQLIERARDTGAAAFGKGKIRFQTTSIVLFP